MPTTATDSTTSRKFIGAVKDDWQLYSGCAEDYTIGSPIGYGATSIVYSATFNSSIPCALKVVDLDRLPQHALHLLMQETQLMSLSKHPNVLRVRGTWMDGHKLYIALRLMNAGSAADVMRFAWTGGMEEEVIKCILKQALEGLNYLHINGLMHRDVKAANLLIDDDGTVLLGDLGVAAPLWDTAEDIPSSHAAKRSVTTSHFTRPGGHVYLSLGHGHGHHHTHHKPHRILGKRKSFVGTPCWMAPEVITGKQYDASADIWSFGITALELAQGRAPHSRAPPASVLAHIATAPPPALDRANGVHTYSAAFAEMVAMCLEKDPGKRPSAEELLASSFFRGAKKKGYLVGTVLKGLPPLNVRQERKRVPSMMTHATMESWDFSLREDAGSARHIAVASPTTSVHSFHSHTHGGRRPRNTLPPEGVFEIEDEFSSGGEDAGEGPSIVAEGGSVKLEGLTPRTDEDAATYARRIRARQRSSSISRSQNVSWVESIEEDSDSGLSARVVGASTDSSLEKPMQGLGIREQQPLRTDLLSATRHLDLPSTSPAPSHTSRSGFASSATSHSSQTDPPEPVTPSGSSSSMHVTSSSASGGFWSKFKHGRRERETDASGGASTGGAHPTPSGGETKKAAKAKTFGGVQVGMQKLAAKTSKVAQAGLVRTASRPSR